MLPVNGEGPRPTSHEFMVGNCILDGDIAFIHRLLQDSVNKEYTVELYFVLIIHKYVLPQNPIGYDIYLHEIIKFSKVKMSRSNQIFQSLNVRIA